MHDNKAFTIMTLFISPFYLKYLGELYSHFW